ncbi:MAG: dTMP kinase [Candidatus Poribacteria bacterium]|nr:dTMP kinase [Candidatus Poribacteria bacterium]MDE0505043.1 dTMP kinase [Candidatus Poribacteria bacterium]
MAGRGLFITFEGVEGAGKSSQIRRLVGSLEEDGVSVFVTREPGGTAISERIRELLLERRHRKMVSTTELLLYAAARSQHVAECIAPALEEGRVVISDRFGDATTAYQGHGRGLDLELIHRLNNVATGGLVPDLTIVLDVPVKVGLGRARRRRRSMDRLEIENLEFHQRVRQGYLAIAKQEPNRVTVINSRRHPKRVHGEIRDLVNQRMSS